MVLKLYRRYQDWRRPTWLVVCWLSAQTIQTDLYSLVPSLGISRQAQALTNKERHGESERGTEGGREGEEQRERGRDKDRERERERETKREKDKQSNPFFGFSLSGHQHHQGVPPPAKQRRPPMDLSQVRGAFAIHQALAPLGVGRLGGVGGSSPRAPSHQLFRTGPRRKTTFLLERAFLHFHASWWEGTLFWVFKGKPKGNQRETKGNQRETKGKPKGNQRETKGKPKGNQRETKGKPKGNQRETKGKPLSLG